MSPENDSVWPSDARALVMMLAKLHFAKPATSDDLKNEEARIDYAIQSGKNKLVADLCANYKVGKENRDGA